MLIAAGPAVPTVIQVKEYKVPLNLMHKSIMIPNQID